MAPTVICDQREFSSEIPELLASLGADIIKTQLDVADYIIGEEISIERKTIQDLDASIKDGRLRDQTQRMKEAYSIPILLIITDEKSRGSLPEHSRMGALAQVIKRGVSVFHASSNENASALIYRLAKQNEQQKPYIKSVPKTRKHPQESSIDLIASIPGMSQTTATALLDKYGSIANLSNCTIKELTQVTGVGKGRAKKVFDVLHHDHKDWENNVDF